MALNDSRVPRHGSRLPLNGSRMVLNDSRVPRDDSRVPRYVFLNHDIMHLWMLQTDENPP
jgi:hypothetical protein